MFSKKIIDNLNNFEFCCEDRHLILFFFPIIIRSLVISISCLVTTINTFFSDIENKLNNKTPNLKDKFKKKLAGKMCR